MKILRTGLSVTVALTLTTAITAPVRAQDGSGLRGTLSFAQGLEVSDNPDLLSDPDGATIISRTELGFRLDSETRTERLRFSIETDLEGDFGGADTDEDQFELTNNQAQLQYSRMGANARLDFSARYREANIDDEVFGFFVGGVFDPDALVIDGGTRRSTRVAGTLETGIGGPLNLRVSGSTASTRYIDTLDPELEDSDTVTVDALARFRINPAVTGRLAAGVQRENEDDATDTQRETTYVGAGVDGELTSGLSYEATLLFDSSETTQSGTVVDDNDGIGFAASVTQARPDGALSFNASSRIDDAGRVSQVGVSRAYDLPDGGLSVTLGILDRDDESLRLTTGLSYSKATPRGGLSANLTQNSGTDDGDAFLNTSLSIAYQEAINATSSWDATIRYSAANELGSSDDDSRASASVAYNRQLTEDWGLRTGVEHVRVEEDGGDNRTSNTLFLSIERDITFGF